MASLLDIEDLQEIEVDLIFETEGPSFGDVVTICGYENADFPPSGRFNFHQFEDLQFSQIDDYFGVRNLSEEGDDVIIWLYPMVGGDIVDHNPGPFDGLRLNYDALRNPIKRSQHFLKTLEALGKNLPVRLKYQSRQTSVMATLEHVRRDISSIADFWASQDVTVGSDDALLIDL